MTLRRRHLFALLFPLGGLVTVFLLAPAALGLLATLTTYAPNRPTVAISGLANYAAVFRNGEFVAGLRNITVFTLVGVPLDLVIGVGLAYVLRRPFRGRGLVTVLLLAPWLVSPIANGVMWHFLFSDQTGLFGYVVASAGLTQQPSPLGQKNLALIVATIVDVWRTAPFVTFLVLPGMSAISETSWEQAMLDGASSIGKIRHVALPALRPLLAAIALILVGASLGAFDSLLILTGGGPGTATTTPGLFSYRQVFELTNWPIGSTAAWLIGGAVLVVGLLYLRFAPREAE